MKKRMTLTLIALAVFITAIGSVKFRQVKAGAAQNASFQPPPEAVTTIVARQEQWPDTLGSIGTVTAVRGVTVSADLPGVVDRITFESGRTVQAGEILVELDTRQERAQLAAAEAQRDLTRLSLDRARGLRQDGVVAQADDDKAVAENKQAEAVVGEILATIQRKTIRAPFTGILGIRQANLGQYMKAGDPIVSLQSLNPIYVHFALPQQQVGRLRIGGAVRVAAEGIESQGSVTAIDSVIDEATRNVQVQATFGNRDGKLRPGMFVETRVLLGVANPIIALPASAISYAPYGDSVFIVTDIKGPNGKTYRGVQQQFVKLGSARGDQISVTSGLKEGQEVVTSGVFKLRNGAAVEVNNKIQPANNPAPKPEDS